MFIFAKEDGFTLVEILVAMFLLSMIVLLLTCYATISVTQQRMALVLNHATQLALDDIEQCQAIALAGNFTQIVDNTKTSGAETDFEGQFTITRTVTDQTVDSVGNITESEDTSSSIKTVSVTVTNSRFANVSNTQTSIIMAK